MSDILSSLAYLHGKPSALAKLKVQPQDFQVVEQLGYAFSGHGEHLMVRIRKSGENTAFVANELAKVCGVKSRDVSWAGLKDRHAITEQWLSVYLPKGETPDFSSFLAQYPNIEILEVTRHDKKLRPGDLQGNKFTITLTQVSDTEAVLQKLPQIKEHGVPNYFGSQRFGKDGNNVAEARRWGRENVRTRNQNKRSLYLSAARSWIFNQIVSERIKQGVFAQFIAGDIAQLANGEQLLLKSTEVETYQQLLNNEQAFITAALAGDNDLPSKEKAHAIEQIQLSAEPDLMALIRGNRMRHDRRPVRLAIPDLQWQSDGNSVTLSFSLPSGCFATAVIRELAEEIPVERVYS